MAKEIKSGRMDDFLSPSQIHSNNVKRPRKYANKGNGKETNTKNSDYSSGSSEAASEPGTPVRVKRISRKVHWMRHHCHFCPYIAPAQRKLTKHMLHHDRISQISRFGNRLHLCSYCSYTTIRSDHMQVHTRLHFNVRDYMIKKGFRVRYGRFWGADDSISYWNVNESRCTVKAKKRMIFKYKS